jgi:hypothetical protein
MQARIVTALVVGLLLAVAVPARGTLPSGNLLKNPGAEDGPGSSDTTGVDVPSWRSTGATAVRYGAAGGFPPADLGAALGGGKNFFAGGPENPTQINRDSSVLQQQFVIPASADGDVDSGAAIATIGGCLGGYGGQDDSARVSAEFFVVNQDLGSDLTAQGPNDAARGGQTALLPRASSGKVPVATREIEVFVVFDRHSGAGTYNDGYADNLFLTLTPAGTPTPAATCPQPTAPVTPPGGGGSPGGGGTPASPSLVVGGSSSARLSASRSRIAVSLACPAGGGPCAGTVSLTVPSLPHATSVKLGSASFSIAAGATSSVQVRLGHSAKRRLAHLSAKRLRRLRLTARVTGAGGSRSFRLRLA